MRTLVEPIAAVHGVRLLDVEWTRAHGGRVLRLIIESLRGNNGGSPMAGVTLDDCVRVSRDASVVLDVEDPITDSYNLEVSSPGLDRPLSTVDDFQGVVGAPAKVKLSRPSHDGQRVLRGLVLAVADGQLRMEVDGKEHAVPLADVVEARRVIDFGGQAAKRGDGGGQRIKRAKDKRRGGPQQRGSSKASTDRRRSGSRKEG
ncbi:MAG: ribosome maturation factor RimP [Deltaproteobacteria bacterium]|nr:ribosome maturation factor RimP [Deltaproteobacteria bacterium]MBW2531392.1 ribosome maturation factor RimP [Deltaproteobacteria bacterium]